MIQDDVLTAVKPFLRKMKRTGSENVMAVCPFHRKSDGSEENTPSFSLSLVKGVYFCFSCHERGSLQKFLKLMGVSPFLLETQYKYTLEELSKQVLAEINPISPVLDSNEALPESLLGLFQYCPTSLLEEGFTEETLAKFEVGYDKFYNRITYPLRDCTGKLVGISGRATSANGPRYKVYDEEYKTWGIDPKKLDKRLILWNYDKVYPAAYFTPNYAVVLVEGFKACMWLDQVGFSNVEALLGSYMSKEQQWMLEHQGAGVYLMLDNDEAGHNGRTFVAKALSKSIPVRIVEYPAKQPTDLSPGQVAEAIEQSIDYTTWAIQGVRNGIR